MINKEIKVSGLKSETVAHFKYLGNIISERGSDPEIRSRIAQTTTTLARLLESNQYGQPETIPLKSQIRLMRALIMSVFCMD